ncbi:DUF397 domain-containing protein [Streptomyces profundus]|uniref:DUF397 domain-containing protein n=1 Tax=Streptomyces profundus TaxID=2867410 RepID=UPI001D1619FE|nr:DUF397 domain-containing protein [Streptomyces sp. MA3_2.13]UED85702.1 DUF397 domain-containing protein [Streptomyces sp. MA3_2.13]
MRSDLPERGWWKSSYSGGNTGDCVEVQLTHDGLLAVGDSKDRGLGAFTFAPAAWSSFLDTIVADAD